MAFIGIDNNIMSAMGKVMFDSDFGIILSHHNLLLLLLLVFVCLCLSGINNINITLVDIVSIDGY